MTAFHRLLTPSCIYNPYMSQYVSQFLELGADVSGSLPDKRTPLEAFLANCKDRDGWYTEGHLDNLAFVNFLQKGADPNISLSSGEWAVFRWLRSEYSWKIDAVTE